MHWEFNSTTQDIKTCVCGKLGGTLLHTMSKASSGVHLWCTQSTVDYTIISIDALLKVVPWSWGLVNSEAIMNDFLLGQSDRMVPSAWGRWLNGKLAGHIVLAQRTPMSPWQPAISDTLPLKYIYIYVIFHNSSCIDSYAWAITAKDRFTNWLSSALRQVFISALTASKQSNQRVWSS